MKKIILILAIIWGATLLTEAQKPADNKATKETFTLLKELSSNIGKGIMIGHQDDLVYGHSWNVVGISDVKKTVGDFPALFGWELADVELGHPVSIDGVDFSIMKSKIVWVNAHGGVNEISWHCNNPLTGANAWDVTSKEVVKSVLPGGEKNELFVKMLNKLADFFLSIKDEKGNLIPVVFRPWHEHTGSWFWWGQNLCSSDEYIALWKYTVSQLQGHGVHNLLYAYSSAGGPKDANGYLERYPGDNIVDLLGFDEYQNGVNGKASFIKSVAQGMNVIIPLAKEHHKIAILAETGLETLPDPKWFTETLWPAIKDYPIAYVLFWRNAHDKPNHFYVPYPGQTSEGNFKEFEKIDRTLFLHDLQHSIK